MSMSGELRVAFDSPFKRRVMVNTTLSSNSCPSNLHASLENQTAEEARSTSHVVTETVQYPCSAGPKAPRPGQKRSSVLERLATLYY
jgi:hypothetical protein